MGETVVLLHGSANGSYSWGQVRRLLAPTGSRLLAPDMLGYGRAPAPSDAWTIAEETRHLQGALALRPDEKVHLVAHSLGGMFALHLLRALGRQVDRLTLIDPVVVSVLRETGEHEALDEMEAQYQRFLSLVDDPAAAAEAFVEHWSGEGSWEWLGDKARALITSLVPRLRLEMIAARSDMTPLGELITWRPETTVLVGEQTRIAALATSQQLARAFGAQIVVAVGAGHMIPLTHPKVVADTIRGGESTIPELVGMPSRSTGLGVG